MLRDMQVYLLRDYPKVREHLGKQYMSQAVSAPLAHLGGRIDKNSNSKWGASLSGRKNLHGIEV
jgi:hypothetical protein